MDTGLGRELHIAELHKQHYLGLGRPTLAHEMTERQDRIQQEIDDLWERIERCERLSGRAGRLRWRAHSAHSQALQAKIRQWTSLSSGG